MSSLMSLRSASLWPADWSPSTRVWPEVSESSVRVSETVSTAMLTGMKSDDALIEKPRIGFRYWVGTRNEKCAPGLGAGGWQCCSRPSAAGMRRTSLQGCIHGVSRTTPPSSGLRRPTKSPARHIHEPHNLRFVFQIEMMTLRLQIHRCNDRLPQHRIIFTAAQHITQIGGMFVAQRSEER